MYSYNVIASTRARMVSYLDSSGPSLRSGQDTTWKYIVSSWRRTALRYTCTIFLVWFRSSQTRFHSDLGNKVISGTFSRDWRELFAISFAVSKILRFKHAGLRFWRRDRDVFPLFSTTSSNIQKKALFSPSAMFMWWVYYKNRSFGFTQLLKSVRENLNSTVPALSPRSRRVRPCRFL